MMIASECVMLVQPRQATIGTPKSRHSRAARATDVPRAVQVGDGSKVN